MTGDAVNVSSRAEMPGSLAYGIGGASAGQPANPGCFGQDRANIIKTVFIPDAVPGASAWGATAGDRAGTNGGLNRDYKTSCGGNPTP